MSKVCKVEAVVDAISKLHNAGTPDSPAYQLRNPLMIKSFARLGKHETTPEGVRIFSSFLAGYRAAIFDVQLKMEGKSRAGLKPTDTLANLLGCYGLKEDNVRPVVLFLKRALDDQSISNSTPLSYFLPEKKESDVRS